MLGQGAAKTLLPSPDLWPGLRAQLSLSISPDTNTACPPCRLQGADGLSEPEGISLKRVAVVEDFFDIIYSMHVESSAEPGKAPKHAGQKKTYRAVRLLSLPLLAAPGLGRRPWAPHMLGGRRGWELRRDEAAFGDLGGHGARAWQPEMALRVRGGLCGRSEHKGEAG